MRQKKTVHLGWSILLLAVAFESQLLAQNQADRLLEVNGITVKGTRLPSAYVIRLSGIKVRDKVNDRIVNTACRKITATGLVKTVDYAYEAYPDRSDVALILTLADEQPALPATIKPAALEQNLWQCLQSTDPIFTRELPPTEKALAFYSKNVETCLQTSGHPNQYASSSVTADANGKLTGVIFEIRQYKSAPPRK